MNKGGEIGMKKEINDFKQNNGNISYTTKELIQALHIKIDKLSDDNDKSRHELTERLERTEKRFREIEGSLKTKDLFLKIFSPIIVSVIGSILYLMLRLHNII